MILDKENLGQIFTPKNLVKEMVSLIKNNGKILEPSSGSGNFLNFLPNEKTLGIEVDSKVITDFSNTINQDFFTYPTHHKFHTIIGNPPYVRFQDIKEETKKNLGNYESLFDKRTNLYLFFIYKCLLHLEKKGEIIFITPRDFLKSTSAIKLNNLLYNMGTITDFIELGDQKIFNDAQPNCVIWRFEKDNFTRKTNRNLNFKCIKGQLYFFKTDYTLLFNDFFFVKVGAVSGSDKVFTHRLGNVDFVCSSTAKNGKTKRMFYNKYHPYLENYKEALINRKVKCFNENNWYLWGRDYFKSEAPRIYVNAKTRNKKPFFIHKCKAYDGSILAIFPKLNMDLNKACDFLNNIDWQELGFVCDGRFLFSQKSLENTILPKSFKQLLSQKSLRVFHKNSDAEKDLTITPFDSSANFLNHPEQMKSLFE